MSKVGGVGPAPPPEGKGPAKKGKKKPPKGSSFADLMKKKADSTGAAEGRGGRFPDQVKRGEPGVDRPGTEGAGKDAGGKQGLGPGPSRGTGPVQGKGVREEDAAGTPSKVREEVQSPDAEKADPSRAAGQAGVPVSGPASEAAPVQEAKATQLPPDLVNKIVETVRVGQNRAGATEVQVGLKSTVFEGMNVRVSSKEGVIQVTLQVEQIAAKDALETEISKLQGRLESQGLDVGEINVELRDSTAAAGSQAGTGQDERGGEAPDQSRPGLQGDAGAGPGSTREGDGPEKKKPDSRTDYTL